VEPQYDLGRVQATAPKRLELQISFERLIRLRTDLGENWARTGEFACAVICELVRNELSVPDPSAPMFDVYGHALSGSLQEQYAIEGLVTWYVKVRLERVKRRDRVVVGALHAPSGPMVCRGGTLEVAFARRWS